MRSGVIFYKGLAEADARTAVRDPQRLGRLLGYLHPTALFENGNLWAWWMVDKTILWGEAMPDEFDAKRLAARLRELERVAKQIQPGARASVRIDFARNVGNPYVA